MYSIPPLPLPPPIVILFSVLSLPIVVMNSMKELTQRTAILSDPTQVPRQLLQYAQESAIRDQQSSSISRRQQQPQQQTLDAPLYS